MQVAFEVMPGCTVTANAKDAQGVFKAVSYFSTLFGTRSCGNCSSPEVKPRHDKRQDYDFYSIQCADCGYALKFGTRKEDLMMFPKGWEPPYKKDKDGDDDQTEQPKNNRRSEKPKDSRREQHDSDNDDSDDDLGF